MIGTSFDPSVGALANQAESIAAGLRTDNVAVDKATEDFEGVFVSLLLKEMRRTLDGDGLFAGDASDAYGGLFDMYLGQHIAQAGGLGISEILGSHLHSAKTPGSQSK